MQESHDAVCWLPNDMSIKTVTAPEETTKWAKSFVCMQPCNSEDCKTVDCRGDAFLKKKQQKQNMKYGDIL